MTQGAGPGLGAVNLTAAGNGGQGPTWSAGLPVPDGFEFYYSLNKRTPSGATPSGTPAAATGGSDGGRAFLSLAPAASGNHSLGVVAWDLVLGTADVAMVMANAHPPGSKEIGTLGYVADTATASM